MPKAYINAFIETPDFPAFYANYIAPSAPILERHGGVILAATNEVDVKEDPMPKGFAVLFEFPSKDALQAFYVDPEYVPLIEVRRAQGASALVSFPGT
ncbi:MAG: DUF1330 domain-containing protein [Rhodobacteraceae bacterium]|nr:DUF1330 domain-containing protein [Paracoccaceae bacterium]